MYKFTLDPKSDPDPDPPQRKILDPDPPKVNPHPCSGPLKKVFLLIPSIEGIVFVVKMLFENPNFVE